MLNFPLIFVMILLKPTVALPSLSNEKEETR